MIELVGRQLPSRPEEFERELQAFDRDLIISWHKPPTSKPGRWKIEQCIQHSGKYHTDGRPKHDHLCERIYVMMVQDDEGTPLPLGEHVFQKLGAMRANVESLGGATERGLRNFIQRSNDIDAERAAKREAAGEDVKQHNRKFNRLTFNRLAHLMGQHDFLRPNR